VLPMLMFGLFNWLIGFEVAAAVLISLGLAGIVLHQKIMKIIVRKYATSKHKMIEAFSKES